VKTTAQTPPLKLMANVFKTFLWAIADATNGLKEELMTAVIFSALMIALETALAKMVHAIVMLLISVKIVAYKL